MLIFGDLIENHLGATLALSTMASAALGNTISDFLGIGLSGAITQFGDKLGLPNPQLTSGQSNLPLVKIVAVSSSCICITIGCLTGMTPLLFLSQA